MQASGFTAPEKHTAGLLSVPDFGVEALHGARMKPGRATEGKEWEKKTDMREMPNRRRRLHEPSRRHGVF
jgi:hypothetical protein